MSRVLLLAWRYVAFNKVKTAVMVASISLTLFFPLAVHVLIGRYGEELVARAKTTPLLVGAKGSSYDLVLKALYFKAELPDAVSQEDADAVLASGLGVAVPLHVSHTVRKVPIVGTNTDYFHLRGLVAREGTLPVYIGDCVLGSGAAEKLGLGVGDGLMSDQKGLVDLAKSLPLKMKVVGVLEEARSPDDHVVFADVKTAWIMDGVFHGHEDAAAIDPASGKLLSRAEAHVVAGAAVTTYNEVTPENMDTFHAHGDPGKFPVTAVLVFPESAKAATILKGRYRLSETRQVVEPLKVIRELMGIVFRVQAFFDANFALVILSTALFLVLVVLLSLRLRRREVETLFKMGCSRTTVFWMQAGELAIVSAMSLVVAGAVAGATVLLAPGLAGML